VLAGAQQANIDADQKEQIIGWVCEMIKENHVFPEMAARIDTLLRKNLKREKYETITTVDELISALTKDMQAVSKDLHLKLLRNDDPPPPDSASQVEKEKYATDKNEHERQENFYFKEIRHMPGNIGYLRFDKFADPRYAGTTAVAAMNFLADCDALIIDLRYNGGGHSTMQQMILSYFFEEPVHIINSSKRNTTDQDWTYSYVPGRKLTGADLYVLTSNAYTFSAAEGFAFALKNMDRATIIGETTSGGAHSIGFFYLRDYHVELRVPTGQSSDPTTGETWEITGVEPHIKVPADTAFDTAYVLALEKLYTKAEGPDKISLKWIWEYQNARLNPVVIPEAQLKKYAGEYGPVSVKIEGVNLLLRQPGDDTYKPLLALTDQTFIIEDNENIRTRFDTDTSGNIIAITAMSVDGSSRSVLKTQKPDQTITKKNSDESVPGDQIIKKLGIVFIQVAGDTFQMGDVFGEGSRAEIPVHPVSIGGFEIATKEITFSQYDRFCEETGWTRPADQDWGRANRPVIGITWEDAVAFCQWLSRKSGQKIRLPTEAEWEFAARERGEKVRFGNGKDIADPEEMNINGDPAHQKPYSKTGTFRARTVSVASFAPNALGLYDMAGNVWEWCSDWYSEEYYRNCPGRDPKGPDGGVYRVIRGGSWNFGPGGARCTARAAWTPGTVDQEIGFRVVRERDGD